MSKPDLLMIGGATDVMIDRMEAEFTLHKMSDINDFQAWAAEHGDKVVALATNGHDGVPAHVMEACPNLKVASAYGVGYDAIDTDACIARGIKVSHTPNVLNAEVANTTLMLLLTGYRNFLSEERHARSGDWERTAMRRCHVHPITRQLASWAWAALGKKLLSVYRYLAQKSCITHGPKEPSLRVLCRFDRNAARADVLVCITPGGPSTNKIVNKQVLEALGPDGMVIKVSRGSVIDEEALIEALQSGKLGKAGLDVFEKEPHIPNALKEMDNVVLLPHVGSATHETRAAMGKLTVDNLLQWKQDGTVLTPVPECAHL